MTPSSSPWSCIAQIVDFRDSQLKWPFDTPGRHMRRVAARHDSMVVKERKRRRRHRITRHHQRRERARRLMRQGGESDGSSGGGGGGGGGGGDYEWLDYDHLDDVALKDMVLFSTAEERFYERIEAINVHRHVDVDEGHVDFGHGGGDVVIDDNNDDNNDDDDDELRGGKDDAILAFVRRERCALYLERSWAPRHDGTFLSGHGRYARYETPPSLPFPSPLCEVYPTYYGGQWRIRPIDTAVLDDVHDDTFHARGPLSFPPHSTFRTRMLQHRALDFTVLDAFLPKATPMTHPLVTDPKFPKYVPPNPLTSLRTTALPDGAELLEAEEERRGMFAPG